MQPTAVRSIFLQQLVLGGSSKLDLKVSADQNVLLDPVAVPMRRFLLHFPQWYSIAETAPILLTIEGTTVGRHSSGGKRRSAAQRESGLQLENAAGCRQRSHLRFAATVLETKRRSGSVLEERADQFVDHTAGTVDEFGAASWVAEHLAAELDFHSVHGQKRDFPKDSNLKALAASDLTERSVEVAG